MNWVILILAGLFEIAWAIGLKFSQGFTKLYPSLGTVLCLVLSVYLLAIAAKSMPIGTAYAIWVGIGAVGTAIVGMILFREPASIARLICLGLILAGVIGLKLFTKIPN